VSQNRSKSRSRSKPQELHRPANSTQWPEHSPIASQTPPAYSCSRVKLPVKCDYAARAVIGLARHFHTGEAMKVEALAGENGVPANYLVQILIELKARDLVKSRRGREGGYLLARPPSKITLGDVLRAVHGEVFDSPALTDGQCPPELRAAWKKLQQSVNAAADAITFQQLLDEGAEKREMYYI